MYLITGHKGFIGRNLLSYMDYNSIPYTFAEWDKASYVIHLSASTNVRHSITHPEENFEKNSKQTFNLLKKAADYKIKRFIFTSSMGASIPFSPYLASKASGEAYCTAFRNSYNLKSYIVRLSNVYGPCSEHKESVIAKFINATISKQPFYIYGDGLQTRDFVYVKDVVANLLNPNFPFFQLSSGSTTTINSLLNNLMLLSKRYFDYVPEVSYIDAQAGEISNVQPTKGLSNATPLKTGLEETYKWFAGRN